VIHGITGKWDSLASDAVDALSAIGFEEDPGHLAWLLIRRALTHATFDLSAKTKIFLCDTLLSIFPRPENVPFIPTIS
jgi:hypothetical protein